MKTPRSRIASTIADRTLQIGSSVEYAREVAAYLLAEGRVGELDSLLRDIEAEWADRGYVEVIARSAFPLTPAVKNDIVAQVKPLYPDVNKIFVTEVLVPELIGGVQITVANQQLDFSVQAKLNKFKQLTGSKL